MRQEAAARSEALKQAEARRLAEENRQHKDMILSTGAATEHGLDADTIADREMAAAASALAKAEHQEELRRRKNHISSIKENASAATAHQLA